MTVDRTENQKILIVNEHGIMSEEKKYSRDVKGFLIIKLNHRFNFFVFFLIKTGFI